MLGGSRVRFGGHHQRRRNILSGVVMLAAVPAFVVPTVVMARYEQSHYWQLAPRFECFLAGLGIPTPPGLSARFLDDYNDVVWLPSLTAEGFEARLAQVKPRPVGCGRPQPWRLDKLDTTRWYVSMPKVPCWHGEMPIGAWLTVVRRDQPGVEIRVLWDFGGLAQ